MATSGKQRIVMVAVLALAGSVLLMVAYLLAAPSITDLTSQGDQIVRALERHRGDHGKYPTSAIEAGAQLPRTRYGSWRYRVDGDQNWFELSVGDYEGFDPFTLYWSSKTGNWNLDR